MSSVQLDGDVLALQGLCNRNGIILPSRQPEVWAAVSRVLGKLREDETEIERLTALMAPLAKCIGCDGWFPVTAMMPASVDPESSPICERCLEINRLTAIMDRLPQTADKVRVVPGCLGPVTVFFKHPRSTRRILELEVTESLMANESMWRWCYSTREAAEAAKGGVA